METHEVPITWQGKPAIVKVKKLNAGEEAEVQDGSAIVETITSPGAKPVQKTRFLIGTARLIQVRLSIADAPFPFKTHENIKILPGDVYGKIWNVVEKLSEQITEQKK